MTFPRRAAAITGVHTTVQGKKLGRTGVSLAQRYAVHGMAGTLIMAV